MQKAAILGSPVAHSLSPEIHAAAYAAAGLDWRYERFELQPDELSAFLAGTDASWRGFSVTMPLKTMAAELASWRSAEVQLTGVANTLVRDCGNSDGGCSDGECDDDGCGGGGCADGGPRPPGSDSPRPDPDPHTTADPHSNPDWRANDADHRANPNWRAYNTDIAGIVAAISPHLARFDGRAALLGSGATATSALVALRDLNAVAVTIYARNATTAGDLADFGANLGLSPTVEPLMRWADGPESLILSTLPPGIPGPELPARRGVLFDVVYADWPTALARAAAAAGLHVVSGLDMLVYQAAAQFELFTGVAPDLAAMFSAVARWR